MNPEDQIKSFGMTNILIEADLDAIERKHEIDLGRNDLNPKVPDEIELTYFPQFDAELRNEASDMAGSYELFYCLEKTIRSLISEMLESSAGEKWWDKTIVPQHILGEVKKRIQREKESAFTPRSTEPLDYTTFGELGEIIKNNWDLFGSVFTNIKAVQKVMTNLNTLRNSIAHCSVLAEDEKLRLDLSLRDWFRLME